MCLATWPLRLRMLQMHLRKLRDLFERGIGGQDRPPQSTVKPC